MVTFRNRNVVFSGIPCSGLQSLGGVQKTQQRNELQRYSLHGPFTLIYLAGAKPSIQYHTVNENLVRLESITKQVTTLHDSRCFKYRVIHRHVSSEKQSSLLSYATLAQNRHLQTISNLQQNEVRRTHKSTCSSNVSKGFVYGSQNSFLVLAGSRNVS